MLTKQVVTGLFGVVLGAVLTYYLALNRDRRNQYNDAVFPVKQKLLHNIDMIFEDNSEVFTVIEDELKSVRGIISEAKYREAKKHLNKYRNICEQEGEVHVLLPVPIYSKGNKKKMADCLRKIVKLL